MAGELIKVLQQSDLLSNLPLAVLGPLAETATVTRYGGGELVFEVDANDDTLYIVRSGVVEIRTHSEGARLATLRAGQSFGELAAFDAQPRSAAAVAKTDCELVGVTRGSLVEVFNNAPGALMATVSNLARSLTDAKEQVTLVNRFLEDKVRERTEEVRQTQTEIIHRLGTAAEFRDDDTGAHIYRMSQYCKILAEGAGLADAAAEELLLAAPMHDVGKIGVPDHVLLKPGALDEEEWRIMQAHTTMGAQILGGSRSPAIQLAEQIALEHHEKWDGTGYPNGLAGENISLEARICTIADVFDALTSSRPYKEPWPFDKAMGLIDNSRGTMFDPELVNIFLADEDKIREIHTASIEGTLQPPSWRAKPIDPLGDDSAASPDDED